MIQGMAARLASLLRWCAATGLVTVLFTTAPANAAAIYKSVDEHGNVQFSQMPPKDRPSENIDTGGTSMAEPAAIDPAAAPPADVSVEVDSDRATDPTTEIKVFDRDKARDACRQAREQRKAVTNRSNELMIKNEDGKYQPMTETQRQERLERLDVLIEESCVAAGDD